MSLRLLTAGESHGPGLSAILEGIPAGLPLTPEPINHDLARRQEGYGAGARMKIEQDAVRLLGGVMEGLTTGAPVALWIEEPRSQTLERQDCSAFHHSAPRACRPERGGQIWLQRPAPSPGTRLSPQHRGPRGCWRRVPYPAGPVWHHYWRVCERDREHTG